MTGLGTERARSVDYSRVARVLIRIAVRLVTENDQRGGKRRADDRLLQGLDRGASR